MKLTKDEISHVNCPFCGSSLGLKHSTYSLPPFHIFTCSNEHCQDCKVEIIVKNLEIVDK